MGSLNPPHYFLEIEMALKVDAIGVVVLPPKKKVSKKGVTFWELVVNFGENSGETIKYDVFDVKEL